MTMAWGPRALGPALGLVLAAVPLTAQQRFPEILRPVFLTGQVVLEDGTPPPDSVIVTMSCHGGRPLPQGYTDSYGRFNFEAGRNVAAMMDVQNANPNPLLGSGNVSTADLTGCGLRAEAAGFASSVIDLSGRRLLESPNVGTLELKKLEGVVGTAFSAMTMHARNDAKKAYERGRALANEEKFDEAVDEFERAVRIEPLFAAASFELGRLHHDLGAQKRPRRPTARQWPRIPSSSSPTVSWRSCCPSSRGGRRSSRRRTKSSDWTRCPTRTATTSTAWPTST